MRLKRKDKLCDIVTPKGTLRSWLRKYIWLRSKERTSALKRDKYTCVKCGSKQSKAKGREISVAVHHIDGIDWDEIVDIIREKLLPRHSELQTICTQCHKKEHENE